MSVYGQIQSALRRLFRYTAGLLDDAYINYAGLRNEKKQAINAICAVTTDRVINLMLMDGTKNELILKALTRRLTDNRIVFDDRVMKKYKGVFFKRP